MGVRIVRCLTFKILQVIPYTEDGMGLAKRLRAVAHELERVVDHFKDNHVDDNDNVDICR